MKFFGWIFLFFIVVYIIPLGSRPMVAPEEFSHAEIAREMVVSDSHTLPTLFGEVQIGRFPMSNWLTAGTFKLFGVNAFAARLPSAVAVGLTALFIAWFIQQTMRDEKLAALSAQIYLTFSVAMFAGGAARPMAVFTLFAAMSLGMFFLASQEEKFNRRKILLIILGGIASGAAFLSGGLAGIILPVVVFMFYLLCNHSYKNLLTIMLPGMICAIIPIAPYLMQAEKLYPGFCAQFLSWSRFSAGIGTYSPWHRCLSYFVVGLFPVVILMPAAVMAGKEAWQKLFRQPLCRFALLGVVIPPIYLVAMRNIAPGMVALSFPAMAILTAMGLQAYFNAGGHHRSYDWMLNVWALFLLVTGVIEGILWYLQDTLFREYFVALPISNLFLLNLAIASLIGGGVLLYSLRGNWRSRLYLFFFTVAILPLGVSWCFTPSEYMPEDTYRELIGEMDIIVEKSTFVTDSKYAPMVSWSTNGGKVVIWNKQGNISNCCNDETVCVILQNCDPEWKNLPRPEKVSSNGNISCAVFRNCIHERTKEQEK